jgi:hypothetical protein
MIEHIILAVSLLGNAFAFLLLATSKRVTKI